MPESCLVAPSSFQGPKRIPATAAQLRLVGQALAGLGAERLELSL